MYRFSFKVRHKGCYETAFSAKFPEHHITVVDIQSVHPKEKQYFYYISGDFKAFDSILKHLKNSKGYKRVEEIERTNDTLLLLVVLYQTSYIQNIIQKYHGFFIELHTVTGGYEFWHIGVVKRESIEPMLKELKKMGELKVLHIGKVEFGGGLLSKQQKKVLTFAQEQGYYELPRKTTMAKLAKALHLNPATVGEHLLKAENKLISSSLKRL